MILNRINVEFSMEISVLRYLEPKNVSNGMHIAVFCFAVTVVVVDIVWNNTSANSSGSIVFVFSKTCILRNLYFYIGCMKSFTFQFLNIKPTSFLSLSVSCSPNIKPIF